MLALWVGFVLSLLLVLVPSMYMSCIPLGVLFNKIVYQSKNIYIYNIQTRDGLKPSQC